MLYLPREEGQGLVEYALILVLVAVVVVVNLAAIWQRIEQRPLPDDLELTFDTADA